MSNVLELLKEIPRGKITTYGELAKTARTSPRAVGLILRNNREPQKYPCYKVIKSSGEIGGYCGIANSRKKIALLKKDGIAIKNGKVDLEKYFYKIVL